MSYPDEVKVGIALTKLAVNGRPGPIIEELSVANVQFQTQVGDALTKLAGASTFEHQRLDALESQA